MAWDELQSAINDLATKTAASRRKDVKFVVERLPSLLSTIESSTPSPNELDELYALLRKPLVPLYATFLLPTMRLAAALVDGIHKFKIVVGRSKHDVSLLPQWERLQRAITAGVLDYLEETTTPNASKSTIENCMFSVVCQHYFPLASESSYEEASLDLRCNVHLLLSNCVEEHPVNQSKLRDSNLLGGARLGLSISRTKEFLALESLFELFAGICPPKSSIDKHRRFVDSVFNPTLFPLHKDLKNIAGSLNSNDWEAAATKFIEVLARMDISFPQPVPLSNAEISDGFPSPSGRMYVDRDGLTSNIEQDDAYDTFFIPYSNISKIHYSSYSTSSTTFTFDLTTPPTFGGVIPETPQAVTLAIDIPRGNREQFMASLKDRGLAHRFDQGERKLSKANNDLPLEFPPSQSQPQTFPEKASRVCDIDPASDVTVKSPDHSKKSSPGLGEPSKKGRALIQSDDEIEEPSPKKLKSAPVPNTIDASHTAAPPVIIPDNERLPLDDDEGELDLGSDKENRPFVKHKGTPDLIFKKRGTKRKPLEEVEEFVDRPVKRSRADPELNVTDISSPLKGKSPHKTRRYGKRPGGRASSPLLAPDVDDSLDSIPKPSKTSGKPSGAAKKTAVAAAMKGKTGKKDESGAKSKATEKVKNSVPAKKANHEPSVVEDAKPTRRSARVAFKQMEAKPDSQNDDIEESQSGGEDESEYKPTNDKLLPDATKKENNKEPKKARAQPKAIANKKTQPPPESKVPQTKAAEKKVQPPPEPKVPQAKAIADKQQKAVADKRTVPQPPPETKATKTKKDKKAPWEKADFLKHKQDDNTYTDPVVSALEGPPSGLDLPAQPFAIEEDFGEQYMDVEVPLKRGPDESSSDPAVDSSLDPDKTTIDLPLKDPSPKSQVFSASTVIPALLPAPDVVEITANVSLRNPTKEEPMRSLNVVQAVPEVKAMAQRMSSTNTDAKDAPPVNSVPSKPNPPAPSIIAPAVPVSPQIKVPFNDIAKPRFNHLPVAGKELSTLPKYPAITNIETVPSLRALPKHETTSKLHKIPPAGALLRKTAIENPEESARVSTPLRPPSKRQPLEPPSIKKQHAHGHQHHVAFSPLPQFIPKTVPPVIGRREAEQRDHVRKLRDAHNSSMDAVFGPQHPHGKPRDREQDLPAEIRGIIEVLQDIQEVIVTKISNRFEGVKKEVRIGRDNVLRAAAADVDIMRAESAEHFNNMVDFEAEYASCRRRIIEPLEDLCAIDKDLVTRLGEIIQHHDRHGLSKKFPKALPALPSCFLNPSVE